MTTDPILERLRLSAIADGRTFDLEYDVPGEPPAYTTTRTRSVYLLRWSDPEDPCFTVNDAISGLSISCEDTKEEAIEAARRRMTEHDVWGLHLRAIDGAPNP